MANEPPMRDGANVMVIVSISCNREIRIEPILSISQNRNRRPPTNIRSGLYHDDQDWAAPTRERCFGPGTPRVFSLLTASVAP